MLKFYRFRSEFLHEGDGTNISEAELHSLEEYARHVLQKCLLHCNTESAHNAGVVWPKIKKHLIDNLKKQVIAAKNTGTLCA